MSRKQFGTFLLNLEKHSLLAIPAPFLGCGWVAAAVWKGDPILYMVGYGSIWLSMMILIILTAADSAFAYMGAAMFFMYALATAALRVALRTKFGISGDMISDCCACCFALPWAIGQMVVEDKTETAVEDKTDVAGSVLKDMTDVAG